MRLAHVRERNGPTGAAWGLAAALDQPGRWLDLEIARRRAVMATPALAHDTVLYRQPIPPLDDLLARGLRVAALGDVVERFVPRDDATEDDAIVDASALQFGP